MICPDPAYRISAMQAYHHPALQPSAPNVIITPHFVRAAADFEDEEPVPSVPVMEMPVPVPTPPKAPAPADAEKKRRKAKKRDNNKDNRPPSRNATPALGESIRQHTSMPRIPKSKEAKTDLNKMAQNVTPSPHKRAAVIVKRDDKLLAQPERDEEDNTRAYFPIDFYIRSHTATKVHKPAQPLRAKDFAKSRFNIDSHVQVLIQDDKTSVRVSDSHATALTHRPSARSLGNRKTDSKANRTSGISVASTSTVQPETKEEAHLKTMRSLEGTRKVVERKKSRDVLSSIKRPAPSPPRPRSLQSQLEADKRKSKEEQRRSLGIERTLEDLREESPVKPLPDVEGELLQSWW